MPFRPHTLAFKLHRAISSGVCTKQTISRSSGVSIDTIEQILKGAKPGPQTTHQLGKVLSYYARQEHHLKLEPEVEEPRETPPVRGVFEDESDFPGVRTFHAVSAKGRKCLHVIAPASDVDELLIEFMEDWLNRLDPPLSLVSPGGDSAEMTQGS